ncbi:universal stress protein [Halobacteriaceae archaeon SHR40]|uniref:universal stress protein n=1 Tax=Halovenus amylolytica TaxID=2500550 RepID=UPI000FE31F70
MYDKILLPFDGSEGASAVLHHASEIAHRTDATIHVLFVADTARESVTVVETDVVDTLVQEGEDIVAEAAKTLDTLGVDYETDVIQGNPAPTIVDYADSYDFDLIVMPTHGREGLSRYLIGSVAEKVVRLASGPVLTVRMLDDERLQFPYEDILIPTDGSAGATEAGEHGLALAATLDATVHILSVVDTGLALGSEMARSDTEQAATNAVEELEASAKSQGITNTETYVDRGKPVEVILDHIESDGIDAVVMGTDGRRGTERILLGSVAEKTVRSAPVPVLTVRKPE